jgi:hypothetical protein
MGRRRWGGKCVPLIELRGTENTVIEEAHRVHKKEAMNRTMVVNDEFKIVFKIDRICKCTNVQFEIDGRAKCMECGIVVPRESEVGV